MPFIIKKAGLQHAITELGNEINLSQKIKLKINSVESIKFSEEFKCLHVYRIIQELVQNTLKYAEAKNIIITFTEKGSDIELKYQDDGVGFDSNQIETGLGLGNLKTRSELLGGHLTYTSAPNDGVLFSLVFPNTDLL